MENIEVLNELMRKHFSKTFEDLNKNVTPLNYSKDPEYDFLPIDFDNYVESQDGFYDLSDRPIAIRFTDRIRSENPPSGKIWRFHISYINAIECVEDELLFKQIVQNAIDGVLKVLKEKHLLCPHEQSYGDCLVTQFPPGFEEGESFIHSADYTGVIFCLYSRAKRYR